MEDGNEGGSGAGDAASGGADQSSGGAPNAPSDSDKVDWKARAEKAERDLAKVSGTAGSKQADLTSQLVAAKNESAADKAARQAAERELAARDVIDEVLIKAPAATRNAIRLAAKGLISGIGDLSDKTKAAQAIVERINSDAPELFKPAVHTMPHVNGESQSREGLHFTPTGKRVI